MIYGTNLTMAQTNNYTLEFNQVKTPSRQLGAELLYELQSVNEIYNNNHKYPITFGDLCDDCAYGYLFVNDKSRTIERSVPYIVKNYSSPNPTFYFDTNDNLDFTDDLPQLELQKETMNIRGKETSILVVDRQVTNSKFDMVLFRLGLIDSGINILPKGRNQKLVSSEYFLWSSKSNRTEAELELDGRIYHFLFEDRTENGVFGDQGDLLTIKEKDSEKVQDIWIIEEGKKISINETTFEIDQIEADGSRLSFHEISFDPIADKYNVGENIAHIKLEAIDESTIELKSLLKKKYSILYFWGTWCKPCIKAHPQLKNIYQTYQSQFEIIAVASNDNKKRVKNYVRKNNIQWSNMMSSDSLEFKLNIMSFPNYLLLDQEGNIKKYMTLDDLEDFLKKNI